MVKKAKNPKSTIAAGCTVLCCVKVFYDHVVSVQSQIGDRGGRGRLSAGSKQSRNFSSIQKNSK